MSNEKQQKIVEMAKDICRHQNVCTDVCKPISACDALRYAERAVEAGYVKQEWISINERLPEDNGDELIVCTEDGFVGAARFTAVIEEGFCWMENEGSDFYDGDLIEGVTHWMPLPEAPKMKGGDE